MLMFPFILVEKTLIDHVSENTLYSATLRIHMNCIILLSYGGNKKMTVFKLSAISTKIKDFKKFEEYFRK